MQQSWILHNVWIVPLVLELHVSEHYGIETESDPHIDWILGKNNWIPTKNIIKIKKDKE